MKCPRCGYPLPEDSEFCQYCGAYLEPQLSSDTPLEETAFSEESEFPINSIGTPISASEVEPSEGTETIKETNISIGGPVNMDPTIVFPAVEHPPHSIDNTQQTFWKRYFHTSATIPLAVLATVLVLSIGINIMQYIQGKEATETVVSQATAIEELENNIASFENEVASLNNTVSTQKSTISSQKKTISSLRYKAEYFDIICKEVSSGNIGYATNNFKASESIIVVGKNEKNRKFTLTASWSGGGTVSVDYSSYSATVSFDSDSWLTSTKMTVVPWSGGVSAVTFSNDVDLKSFKVLIIVTD